VSHSEGYNITSSWGKTATDTVGTRFTAGAGFSMFGLGVTASASHDHTDQTVVTSSIARSFSSTFSETTTTTQSHTFSAAGAHWQFQWVFEYSNGSSVTVLTQNFATAPNGDQPCCFPNYFADDTTPQSSSCLPVVSGMGAVLGVSPELCTQAAGTKHTTARASSTTLVIASAIGVGLLILATILVLTRIQGRKRVAFAALDDGAELNEVQAHDEVLDSTPTTRGLTVSVPSTAGTVPFCGNCGKQRTTPNFCGSCGFMFDSVVSLSFLSIVGLQCHAHARTLLEPSTRTLLNSSSMRLWFTPYARPRLCTHTDPRMFVNISQIELSKFAICRDE
jgi:hypothetical protein